MTCSEANNYCGLCSNHLFLLLNPNLMNSFFCYLVLFLSHLFCFPIFLIFFFFFLKMLKPFSSLPYDAIWRTMLRAFYVETKVDQGGVWFSERVFISLLFLLLQNPRPRRKAYPPLLPLTLQRCTILSPPQSIQHTASRHQLPGISPNQTLPELSEEAF